jgi:C1A family cysteine protease
LFIYYNARAIAGTRDADRGAQLRNCLKSIAWWGAPPEDAWPYDVPKMFDRPPEQAYEIAARTVSPGALRYARVERNLTHLKACLAQGRPFIAGLVVYEAFDGQSVAQSGVLDVPEPHELPVGRLATLVVGYFDDEQSFIVRNSLGAAWGMQGHFLLPFDYMLDTDLSGDTWCVTLAG